MSLYKCQAPQLPLWPTECHDKDVKPLRTQAYTLHNPSSDTLQSSQSLMKYIAPTTHQACLPIHQYWKLRWPTISNRFQVSSSPAGKKVLIKSKCMATRLKKVKQVKDITNK